MTFHDILEHVNITLAIFVALLGIGGVFSKKIKAFAQRRIAERRSFVLLPQTVREIKEEVVEMRKEQQVFSQELKVNGGGSIKDEVRLLAAEKKLELTAKHYPLFRCTMDNENVLVNRAYCLLVGASSERDLLKNGWVKYLANQELTAKFLENWESAKSTHSSFAGTLEFRAFSEQGEIIPRGQWLVMIEPLGDYNDDFLFGGILIPQDELSNEIASVHNWVGCKNYKKSPLWTDSIGDLRLEGE